MYKRIKSFKTAKLDKKRQIVLLKFPMNDVKLMGEISSLDSIQMVGEYWEIPVSYSIIRKLKKMDFILSKSLLNWDEHGEKNPVKQKHIQGIGKGKLKSLYNYQKEGVAFIDQKGGRALIADEMGLGKTVEALSWLELHPENRPVLIICPSSLKVNWYRETEKWLTNPDVTILEGITPYSFTGNIVIINYAILNAWIKNLKDFNFKTIIVDEAHKLKNTKAQRTKAFKKLNRQVKYLIGLTGTPIESKPIEIYNIVQAINPTLFPNYYAFIHKYCGAKRNIRGELDTNGATNTKELHSILKRTVMIRRLKANVLKDLPPKQIVNVPLSIQNRSDYNDAESKFIEFVKSKYEGTATKDIKDELKTFAKRHKIDVDDDLSEEQIKTLVKEKIGKISAAPALAQIEFLKQLAVHGKIDEVINWVETFLDSGEKLVLFAIHRKIVQRVHEHFKGSVKIDGSSSPTKRQEAVDKFQNDPDTKLLVANMQSGGVGLTLTAASNVAIVQLPWSPSIMDQAIDRVHRITQKHQVTAWKLTAENTIEERIDAILTKKRKVITQIIDGKKYKDESVFMELIESYKQIKK